MAKLARLSKADPRVRDAANYLIRHVPEKNWRREIAAIFRYVQRCIRYTLDPHDIELLQSAYVTLKLGYGDCDDKCICLASLLESVGHPCVFTAMGFGESEEYSHVIVDVRGAGEGRPIALDATEPYRIGWRPPGARWIMQAAIEGR